MAAPFATVADLSARGITFPSEPLATELCREASDFLRDEIGWQVYPVTPITVVHRRGWRAGTEVHLPGVPIRAVTQVAVDGVVIDPDRWTLVDSTLIFGVWRPEPHLLRPEASIVEVTYTVGYDIPPAELMRWTRVLVADALSRIADGLPIGATPASLSVDDFRVQFSTRQQSGEPPVPPRVLERLKATYGPTVFVT